MIEVLDYNYEWQEHFKLIESYLRTSLPSKFRIEHVGSTSVVGLAAKPIIDIDIIAEPEEFLEVRRALEMIGYYHNGNQGIEGREVFKSGEEFPIKLPKHHLYCGSEKSIPIRNHLLLRDCLRQNHELVEEYSKVKKKNAELYPDDIDMYIEKKTDVILKILDKAGMDRDSFNQIQDDNKKK